MQKQNKNQGLNRSKSVRFSSCGWHLKTLVNWMDIKMNERLKSLGLSLSQFTIIMVLLQKDGLTQVEIGHEVLLPAYQTSRSIDKLKSLGYVKRKRHESSRRSYRIFLTEAGRDLAPALYEASESTSNLLLSPLKKSQKTEFLRILNLLTSHIDLQTQD